MPPMEPTVIHEDNTACIKLSQNSFYHDRTKHVDYRAHLLRQYHDHREVELTHVPTTSQWANLLTKACPRIEIRRFRDTLMGAADDHAG